ncbi:MAG TPA: hypothetical protein PKZ83_16825 [bacterium]|nr:hypothetical protein [bacterium]HQJ66296.1 hypothetical protein [bacterium]
MGKITTSILVIRDNGTGKNVQKIELPADDQFGFYGTIELKLQSGSLNSVQIPRQSLHIETINREEWEQLVGKIDD